MEVVGIIQTTFSYLLINIAGIFVIVNPLTTAFAFMSLTTKMDEGKKESHRRAVRDQWHRQYPGRLWNV